MKRRILAIVTLGVIALAVPASNHGTREVFQQKVVDAGGEEAMTPARIFVFGLGYTGLAFANANDENTRSPRRTSPAYDAASIVVSRTYAIVREMTRSKS